MSFWTKIKKDIQKGFQDGILLVKEGAAVVKEKAEVMTEEGKKRYKLYALKAKVQKEISDLGGKIYELSSRMRNPMGDKKVKDIIGKIKKLEMQILKIEGKEKEAKKAPARKTASKKVTAKKKTTTRKTTTRKVAAKRKASRGKTIRKGSRK